MSTLLRIFLWQAVLCLLRTRAASLAIPPPPPSTITQVVQLLQQMTDRSKQEGNEERTTYAKYKCYCDTNEKAKEQEIASLTRDIDLLDSEVDALQADSGVLSQQVAKLKEAMAENNASRQAAQNLRDQEAQSWGSQYADLTEAIDQMNESLQVLAEVSADQTLRSAADHTQFMAGYNSTNLMSLKASVQQALGAATAFASRKEMDTIASFLQGAPFTGTYAAQSGEVFGILREMFKTFIANRNAGEETERKAIAAHASFMQHLDEEYARLAEWYETKQSQLSSNDNSRATKTAEAFTAREDKISANTFLERLLEMCATTKKEYDERILLRANEERALAEAISILNSDAAFALFRSEGTPASFLQQRAERRHPWASAKRKEESPSRRLRVRAFLQRTAGAQASPLLSRIAALLQANNPFAVVLAEIDKMLDLIAAEGQADVDQKAFCDDERTKTDERIQAVDREMSTLRSTILTLQNEISEPDTGLKDRIASTEDGLKQNHESQATGTADRTKANLNYQESIGNLVSSQALLKRAIVVLRKYYSQISSDVSAEMIQQSRTPEDTPAPPPKWDPKYEGQSTNGVASINLLEAILGDFKTETETLHRDEMQAQNEYEKTMLELTAEERSFQNSLTSLQASLAQKVKQLFEKKKVLATNSGEKVSLESYLEKIKPGCDFITNNIGVRTSHRATEERELKNVRGMLKGSPAYMTAVAVAHNESLGDCLSICAGNEAHVDCKACLAETSVPGYCAGHPSTTGCP